MGRLSLPGMTAVLYKDGTESNPGSFIKWGLEYLDPILYPHLWMVLRIKWKYT